MVIQHCKIGDIDWYSAYLSAKVLDLLDRMQGAPLSTSADLPSGDPWWSIVCIGVLQCYEMLRTSTNLSYTQFFHVCCKHTDLPMCCTSWLCGQSDLLRSSCLREAREEAPNLQALHCPHHLCHRCHLPPQESALCGNVPQILRSSRDLHPQMRRRSKSVAASPAKDIQRQHA